MRCDPFSLPQAANFRVKGVSAKRPCGFVDFEKPRNRTFIVFHHYTYQDRNSCLEVHVDQMYAYMHITGFNGTIVNALPVIARPSSINMRICYA